MQKNKKNKNIKGPLIVFFALIIVATLIAASPATYSYLVDKFNPSYGQYEDGIYYSNNGLKYSPDSKGYMNVEYGNETSRKFGFVIQSTEVTRSVEDISFTWAWDEDTQIWTAYHSGNSFVWNMYYDFSGKNMKVTHYLENNGIDLTNTKMWYLFTTAPGEKIIFDGADYYLDENHMVTNNLNEKLPLIQFPDGINFNYQDIIDNNFTVTNIYSGTAASLGYPNTRVLAIGVTKGNGNFNVGKNITIDPELYRDYDGTGFIPHKNSGVEVSNGLRAISPKFYINFDNGEPAFTSNDFRRFQNISDEGGVINSSCNQPYNGGNCLTLNGSQKVNFGYVDDFVSMSEITMGGWVRTDVLNANQQILNKWGSAGNGFTLYMDGSDDIGWSFGDSWTGKYFPYTETSEWTFIVATYDGIHGKVYQDGVLLGTEIGGGTEIPDSDLHVFSIGSNNYSLGPGYWDGEMDDLFIYEYALSEDDVANLYNSYLNNESGDGIFFTSGSYESEIFYNETAHGWNVSLNLADSNSQDASASLIRDLNYTDYYIDFNNPVILNATDGTNNSCNDVTWTDGGNTEREGYCLTRDEAPLPGCPTATNWTDAVAYGETYGVRLPTYYEAYTGTGSSTGCSMDSVYVWTSASCGENKHWAIHSRGAYEGAPICYDDTTSLKSQYALYYNHVGYIDNHTGMVISRDLAQGTSGQFSDAINFNATALPASLSRGTFTSQENLTIAFSATSGGEGNGKVIDYGGSTNGFEIWLDDNLVTMRDYSVGIDVCTLTYAIDTTAWNHYGFVFQGGATNDFGMYVNGELVNSTACSLTQTFRATVGADVEVYNAVSGKMDDFVTSTRAFTSTEMFNVYENSMIGKGIDLEDENLVSYWPLDNSYDDLVGSNHGTPTGTNNATGISSDAMRFDGSDDYISVPDNSSLDVNNFAVSVWVNPSTGSIVDKDTFRGIVAHGYYEENKGWEMIINTDRPEFGPIGCIGFGIGASTLWGLTALEEDTWTNVAIVFDGTNASIYLNGVLDNSATRLSSANSPQSLEIGRRHPSAARPDYFDGSIDEVLIYNDTLTSSEVTAIYKAGLSQNAVTKVSMETRTGNDYILDDSLVAFFNMNSNNGTGTDSLVGDYHAKYMNDAVSSEIGLVGNSTYFPLNDYLRVDDVFVNETIDFTISAWIMPIQGVYWGGDEGLAYWYSSGVNDFNLNYDTDVHSTSKVYAGAASGGVTTRAIQLNKWNNLIYTFNSTNNNGSWYINGEFDRSETTVAPSRVDGVDYTFIGSRIETAGGPRFEIQGYMDEIMIFNRTLQQDDVDLIYQNYSIDWNEWEDKGYVDNDVGLGNGAVGKFFQFKSTYESSDSVASASVLSHSVVSAEPDGDPASVSNINWRTTGGQTDDTLIYTQEMDYIKATCDNADSCNITITDPDGLNTTADNVGMVEGAIGVFTYATNFILDKVGDWIITIFGFGDAGNDIQTQTITVATTTQTLADGFFGYRTSTFTNQTIADLAIYEYDLIELRDDASNIESNWSNIKDVISKANELNIKVGLTYYLDYNLTSDTASRDALRNNITSMFDELLVCPYLDALEFIKIEANLSAGYSDTNITDNNLDLIGKDIFDTTGNAITIYTNYNSSTLAEDYIQFADLDYVTDNGKGYMEFDPASKQNITISNTSILNGATEFSVSAWANYNTGGCSDWTGIISTGNVGGSNRFGLICNANNNIEGFVRTASGQSLANPQPETISANEWHHYLMTWNSTTGEVDLYIDGKIAVDLTFGSATGTFGDIDALDIGHERSAVSRRWDGGIDEVRIYDKILTPTQVAELYESSRGQASESVQTANLVSYWKLDGDYVDTQGINNGTCSGTCPTNASGIEDDLVDNLANLTNTKTSLTRIYYDLNDDLKSVSQTYTNAIINPITAGINISSALGYDLVSELDNGDLIVYNRLPQTINVTYNLSNGTDIAGKDIYDYTQGILVANDTNNGTITFLDIPAHTAILVGTEEIDHVEIQPDKTTADVSTQSSSSLYSSNHTDGTRDGASDASTSRATELWDGSYVKASTLVYYGLLDISGFSSPYQFDGLEYLVIADKNDAEVDKLFWDNVSIGGIYGYVAVADYDSTNATWMDDKKAEVDAWADLNESMNIFLDGLDAAAVDNLTAFQLDVQNLTEYVKVTKGRELGINVFTQYQAFAQLASTNGFAMKESCTHRWEYINGVNASDGFNYSNQFWEDDGTGFGDYNKSIWYNNHNVNLVCVPFIDRNATALQPDSTYNNYSLFQKLYFKAKVLGYEHIAISEPTFQIPHYDKYYDLGTKLQSEPTVEGGSLYSMRYSKGTVYYNSSSDDAWFDDGNQFNSGSITVNLHDDATQQNYSICINDYCGYEVNTDASGWDYDWYTISFNETVYNDAYGHYLINVTGTAGGITFIGDDTNSIATYGQHSFYDNSGTWAIEALSTGNHMINLDINLSKSNTIDTTSKLTQIETVVDEITTVVIESVYNWYTKVWSTIVEVAKNAFRRINFWDGSSYVEGLNYTDTTTCNTTNPTFNYTTIDGVGQVGSCIDSSGDTVLVRLEMPNVEGNQTFQVDADTTPPVVTFDYPGNNTFMKSSDYTGELNITLSELGGNCTVSDSRWDNTGINSTVFRFLNNTAIGTGLNLVSFTCTDQWGNSGVSTFEFGLDDTTAPNLTLISPENNTYTTNQTQNFTVNLSDDKSGIKNSTFTLYNSSNIVINQTITTYPPTYTSPHLIGIPITLIDGTYTWNYDAYDGNGNYNISNNRTLTIDTTAPIINITHPTTEDVNIYTFDLIVNLNEIATCSYSVNNLLNVSLGTGLSFSKSITTLDGDQRIDVFCTDAVNLSSSANVSFLVRAYTSPDGGAAGGGDNNIDGETIVPIKLYDFISSNSEWYYGMSNTITVNPIDINGDTVKVDTVEIMLLDSSNFTFEKDVYILANDSYKGLFDIDSNNRTSVFLNITVTERNKVINSIVQIPISHKEVGILEANIAKLDKLEEGFKRNAIPIALFGIMMVFLFGAIMYFNVNSKR